MNEDIILEGMGGELMAGDGWGDGGGTEANPADTDPGALNTNHVVEGLGRLITMFRSNE